MAALLADRAPALRLLLRLTARRATSLRSLGLNNLFLCFAFALSGSHDARTGFFSTLLFQILFIPPLLVASSTDISRLIPPARVALWPLTRTQRLLLHLAAPFLNPVAWVVVLVFTFWTGLAIGLAMLALTIVLQALTLALSTAAKRLQWHSLHLSRFPGALGGLLQLHANHLLTTLDFYAALLLTVFAWTWRLASHAPVPDAYPVLAILIVLCLSTFAQAPFALCSNGALDRLRLLPLSCWKLLLVTDAVFLAACLLLAAPFNPTAALTASLTVLAAGRYPALRLRRPQLPWRFLAGDLRYGLAQIVLAAGLGMAAAGSSLIFLGGAAGLYALSIYFGHRLYRPPAHSRSRLSWRPS